jgi:hypothetical protein
LELSAWKVTAFPVVLENGNVCESLLKRGNLELWKATKKAPSLEDFTEALELGHVVFVDYFGECFVNSGTELTLTRRLEKAIISFGDPVPRVVQSLLDGVPEEEVCWLLARVSDHDSELQALI